MKAIGCLLGVLLGMALFLLDSYMCCSVLGVNSNDNEDRYRSAVRIIRIHNILITIPK